ncbi:MAG: response regulator, partial [Anaerolineales bacterium]
MTNNILILYVEDNPENRLLIRRILEVEGYTVAEAENAATALDFVKNQTPDLILMDINMPDIDGYTLTAQLKTLPNIF